ncbi:MAG: 16S rRNA (cytosine(967)-C(5))-methyltransferase RsmB [Acidobacteria bacterium]|nr:16S rRNA (cytosine(967)-C(5))-methyltransferase RsmB [Acidobacteriota bacterium]
MIAPARTVALQTLQRVAAKDVDLATALDRSRKDLTDERDRALAAEIVLGTLRWRGALDHVIAWAGDRRIGAFDTIVLDILRLSAYQLLHLDRVPASAVVDDAVNLCKQQGHRSASGAVNAILRRISRDARSVPTAGVEDPVAHLVNTWSHPQWLVERWIARLGVPTALAWATFNNTPSPMTLCAHALRMTRVDLAAALAAAGVTTRPCAYAPDGLIVEHGNPLTSALAREGAFLVQDEASQLVGALVAPRSGMRVLDACAAPGGKTAQLAAALHGTGFLVAADVRPRRVRLLRETLRAVRLEGVAVIQHDVLGGIPFRESLDLVLVDAPCSSLVTIRRDPDVRWKRTAADLPGYADRQLRMLSAASCGVKPGGHLVYSTCSSEPEENEQVVAAFLGAHQAFELEDPRRAQVAPDPGVLACLDGEGCLRTTPHQHGLEAFFAARLRRRI